MLTDETLYREAYNAHEGAENAAMTAMRAFLAEQSLEALMCISDPQWGREHRSWMSPGIIDQADDILTARLNALAA